METVVSGIRPTGNLHLGNYFGAVKSFLADAKMSIIASSLSLIGIR